MTTATAPANWRTRVAGIGAVLFDRAAWVVGLGTAIGYANTAASSWLVSALLAEGRLDVERASLVVTAELLAMAFAMIALAPEGAGLPRKAATIFGLAAMVAMQLLSMVIRDFWLLMAVRAGAGASFGLLYSMAIFNGADAANPQKTFAGAAAIALAVGTLFNPLVGYGSAQAGFAGVLAGLVAYCVLLAVPLLSLKFEAVRTAVKAADAGSPMTIDWRAAAGILTIMALLTIASNGALLFTVEVARRVGLKGAELGVGLAAVSLFSTGGGLAAGWVGNRFGRFVPMAVGLVLMAATLGGFTMAQTPAQFWIGITAAVTLFWFLSPYIFALATDIDPKGRLASVTGSVKILSSAFAAGLAGAIAARTSLAAVGQCAAVVCVVTVAVLWLVNRLSVRS